MLGPLVHAMQQMAPQALNKLIDAEVPYILNASSALDARPDAQTRTSSQVRKEQKAAGISK